PQAGRYFYLHFSTYILEQLINYTRLLSLRPRTKPMKLVTTRKIEIAHAVLLIISPEINL
ncbi:MAG: hypothetical protein K6T39_08800, partial [Anoxybacillus ayderensis]|nr:hypothetical protein [Anoxybacillus ayderensis]